MIQFNLIGLREFGLLMRELILQNCREGALGKEGIEGGSHDELAMATNGPHYDNQPRQRNRWCFLNQDQ